MESYMKIRKEAPLNLPKRARLDLLTKLTLQRLVKASARDLDAYIDRIKQERG